jgi:hypothetical protein
MLKKPWFSAHWKLLVVPVAAAGAAVGLAIALSASPASTHRTAGPVAVQSDWAKQRYIGTATHAPGHHRLRTRRAVASGPDCLVSYTPVHWPGSFLAKVTISNRSKADIHGWTLTFRFAGDEAISSAWNATFTQTGAEVSAKGMAFDSTIRSGATQALGFLGAQRSDGPAPDAFRLNGMVCG